MHNSGLVHMFGNVEAKKAPFAVDKFVDTEVSLHPDESLIKRDASYL